MYTIRHFQRVATLVAAIAVATTVSARAADDTNAAKEAERQLIAVLESADSPPAEKAITCKKLAVFGSKDAVAALAPLLDDQELISWARIALEAIPGAEADQALRDAMGRLKGRSLIGVINSIGFRRDTGAVAGLTEKLQNQDAEVASAAAVALGKIGNEAATKVLRQSLAGAAQSVRSAVAEGCIYCAERLLAEGEASQAAAIYDEVLAADVPKQRILEATRGAILARGSEGIPLLVEQLRSDDKQFHQIALMTARELPGKAVADAVADEMEKATPQRGALLLSVLVDRGDASASPTMIKLATSGAKPMRIAAISVLQNSGDPSCVPTLLEIAVEDDEETAAAARAALAEMPGKEIDAQIAEGLPNAQGKTRLVLIDLVGQRQIDATPSLLKAIDDSDARIRSAALTALGETIKQDDLSVLISRVASPKNAEDTPIAEKALEAASVRMPDGEACAADLTAAMANVPLATQLKLLEILGALNNAKSLATLSDAAKSGTDELQDAATRLLGETMTLDAEAVLLDLAKTLPDGKYKIRAIRGHIRLMRQFDMPDRRRVQMCVDALNAAQRADEQKLILEVMERYPSSSMLKLAAQVTENPALKQNATRVMMTIALELADSPADARKLLEQMGQELMKVEIVKAEYGANDKWKDVTKILQNQVAGLPIVPLPLGGYNSAFGGDPLSGVPKKLKIQYRIDGKSGEATFAENAAILLPMPK